MDFSENKGVSHLHNFLPKSGQSSAECACTVMMFSMQYGKHVQKKKKKLNKDREERAPLFLCDCKKLSGSRKQKICKCRLSG